MVFLNGLVTFYRVKLRSSYLIVLFRSDRTPRSVDVQNDGFSIDVFTKNRHQYSIIGSESDHACLRITSSKRRRVYSRCSDAISASNKQPNRARNQEDFDDLHILHINVVEVD